MTRDRGRNPVDSDGWYRSTVDRHELKRLTQRSDARGLNQFGSFMVLVLGSGYVAFISIGTPWAIPAFLLYGTIFAFAEAGAHELGHGTPFRSRRLNEAVHWLVCFMTWREQVFSRYRHARHHTYTMLIGRDTEIQLPRPTNLLVLFTDIVRYRHARKHLGAIIRHSLGVIAEEDREIIPAAEHRRMIWNSRVHLVAHLSRLRLGHRCAELAADSILHAPQILRDLAA